MGKNSKSKNVIYDESKHELLMKNHKEFYDKIGNRRVSELTIDEWKYFVTVVLPDMGKIYGVTDKEEEVKNGVIE